MFGGGLAVCCFYFSSLGLFVFTVPCGLSNGLTQSSVVVSFWMVDRVCLRHGGWWTGEGFSDASSSLVSLSERRRSQRTQANRVKVQQRLMTVYRNITRFKVALLLNVWTNFHEFHSSCFEMLKVLVFLALALIQTIFQNIM